MRLDSSGFLFFIQAKMEKSSSLHTAANLLATEESTPASNLLLSDAGWSNGSSLELVSKTGGSNPSPAIFSPLGSNFNLFLYFQERIL